MERPWLVFCVAAIVLLGAFLGAGTQQWSSAVMLVLVGAIVAFNPPRTFGNRAVAAVAAALLIVGLCSLLPAKIFGMQAWREQFLSAGFQLPATLSPQPWSTIQAWIGMLAGVTWMLWLSLQSWSLAERRAAARVFSIGGGLIALVAIGVSLAHVKIPFWISEWGFGPFANRNQTGNFFALAVIIAVACAREDLAVKKMRVLIWIPLVTALVAGVAMSYSRGATLLLVGGILAWLLAGFSFSRSVKSAAIALSAVFVLMTLLLLTGGETIRRFSAAHLSAGGVLGFRALIHKDCLTLIHAAPWCGIGLGNFDAVFPHFRDASAMPLRVIHPESDWLWLAVEAGWPSVALVVCALGLLAVRIFPMTKGSARHLRAAAAIASLGFLFHGFVDVAGHRLGTAFAGMFVFSLALNRVENGRRDRAARVVFLAPALTLFAFGVSALLATRGLFMNLPFDVPRLEAAVQGFAMRNDFRAAKSCAEAALKFSPLDWELYYWRGIAEARGKEWIAAVSDFRRANFLEPNSPDLPFEEGRLWLSLNPALALAPWHEALRRCPRGDVSLYARMLDSVGDAPDLRWPLYEMGAEDPDLLLTFMGRASREEFAVALKNLLRTDPQLGSLSASHRDALFKIWPDKGDAGEMKAMLKSHPEWRSKK